MKIVTWNVNSIRKRAEIVAAWLEANTPDVLLLQETKVQDSAFPREPFEALGYDLVLHGQEGGRNGVAILAKGTIDEVRRGLPGEDDDVQARYVEAVVNGVLVASIYLPNGTSVGSDNFAYKLRFFERLGARMEALLETERPLCFGGDYNVAPDPIDVYDPEDCAGGICYHDEERRAFRRLVHLGLYDAFRLRHPTRRQFSWWDMRGGSWDRDEGMRIDHLMLSPEAADRLAAADIDASPRAGKGVSDHVPVWCEID